MKPALIALMLLVFGTSAWSQPKAEPPMLGPHLVRGYAHGHGGGGGGSPDMTWQGGPVLPTTVTAAIFWGTSWPTYTGDKISGMDLWYGGVGGSNFAKTSDEYTGTGLDVTTSTPDEVTSSISYNGHSIDSSAAPSRAPSTSTILAEVCKVITNPVSNGYYAVYVDTKRGHAGYCAWHSWGSCGSTPIQFAFFFNLDGDLGCDPNDTSGFHSQGLAALANVSGHELSEARTDPQGTAWFDSSGQENGDKCVWAFGSPYVTFFNLSQWKIQGNWSNYAYDHSSGYPNNSGQNGCLDGGNWGPVAP